MTLDLTINTKRLTEMKKLYIYSVLTAFGLSLCGCADESPFSYDREDGKKNMCEFHKSALKLDIKDDSGLEIKTRGENVDINDFKLVFLKNGEEYTTVIYAKMPEIMLLERGTYEIVASYGVDRVAAWENPLLEGKSKEFEVEPNTITTDLEPIVCDLKNVKVTIQLDPELSQVMGDDSYITVKVGNAEGLDFYKNEEIAKGTAGYFRIDNEKTLVATYNGTINGTPISQETKSLADISAGNHYEVTFKLHNHGEGNHGDSNGEVKVDAAVTFENIDSNVTVKDKLLDDQSERPSQGENSNPGNDPEPGGDEPVTPPTEGAGPTVTADAPINLDDWNIAVEGLQCILNIHSDTGITGFTVKIDSETLTDDILTGVGLAAEFDLISGKTAAGADVKEGLAGLNLPVADEVKDKNDVVFNVTDFMGLLGIYGAANHIFIITVTDASGTTVKELKLRTE